MQGIDLFAGAGGMSLGAEMAGVSISHAVEIDPYAAQTYAINHKKGCVLINDDIRSFYGAKLRRKVPLVVFGGPPCQGFSTSNQRTRNSQNQNNWLFKEFLRVVKEQNPDWVVFENVKGIIETEGGMFVENIASQFDELGYTVEFSILNAADYGVPQKRNRFFLVASAHGIKFEFPEPTTPRNNYITVRDAFIDLPNLQNGANECILPYKGPASTYYSKLMRKKLKETSNHLVTKNSDSVIERYKYVPPGGNWSNIPEHLMESYKDRNRCHTKIYHRLDGNQVATVIGNFRKNMLIHPIENRGLSVREAARLQSFPDDYKFYGSIGFQQQQVGNAVPPLLAKAVFEKIISY